MNPAIPAIKRCDMLLMSALRHVNNGDTQAAVSDLTAALNQLRAVIALTNPNNRQS
jgi:hypothetical protein